MPMPGIKVFLSYSVEDSRPVQETARRLRADGIETLGQWDIPPESSNLVGWIGMVEKCDVVLALLSKNSDEPYLNDLFKKMREASKLIFPVYLEPDAHVPRQFAQSNAFAAEDYSRLLEAIRTAGETRDSRSSITAVGQAVQSAHSTSVGDSIDSDSVDSMLKRARATLQALIPK